MESENLGHFNRAGEAHMVSVTGKQVTARRAIAAGEIRMAPATLETIRNGRMGKGDVLAVARIAAIQASKRTPELIPLAHPLAITGVEARFGLVGNPPRVTCEVEVLCSGQTGVEMEALTAVSVALLTVYDMCKSSDRAMEIGGIRLLLKEGGKSGVWKADPE